MKKHCNIGIVTFPISEAGNFSLFNLATILYSLTGKIYLITGNQGQNPFKNDANKVSFYRINHKSQKKLLLRVLSYIYTQLKIASVMMRLTKNVDLWFFFHGGDGLIVPIVIAKLLRKKVVLVSAASGLRMAQTTKDPLLRCFSISQNITYRLANKILLYSTRLIFEHDLQKYSPKILIAHEHYLDLGVFRIIKSLYQRNNLVGYMGRLSEEKGVLNFAKAIPFIFKEMDEVNFLIGGDGQLRGEIERNLSEHNLNTKVKLTGWISHDNLPQYFNKLKLIVLPSYTEGLPNIMLEAMACGTPVLATPVGAIPDFIKDGETGFIMENNSPKCIAQNIIRVLNHPNLEQIANNGRDLVEKEFTFEKAVEGYREILHNISG